MMDERKRRILDGLALLYPDAKPELDFEDPYQTLVATILAAQCTDQRVNQVTPAVFRDFPTPAAMAQTTPEILFPYVKSCGFKSKATNIVNACKMIVERYGGEVPRTMEELTSLPGVGRKTASVVLCFAFGIPAFPVDTHVYRLTHRLGLVGEKENTPDKVDLAMRAQLPPEQWGPMHHALIYHGRRVCHAQRPDCKACALRADCPSASGTPAAGYEAGGAK